MNIDSYSFGVIVIDGKKYTKDLVMFKDTIKESWWRDQGHLLQWKDLAEIVASNPDILIVGTGVDGGMKIDDDVAARLKTEGIKLFSYKTDEAVKLFNQMKDKNAAAAFHLTC